MSGQVVSASPDQNIGVCPLSAKPISDTGFIKRKMRIRTCYAWKCCNETVSLVKLVNLAFMMILILVMITRLECLLASSSRLKADK